MRFLVDQCVPAEVASQLRERGHDVDDAIDLGPLSDDDVLAYAAAADVTVVTTNAEFAGAARRRQWARAVHLGSDLHALEALDRALAWLAQHPLPAGQVLRVPRRSPVAVMTSLRNGHRFS